MEHCPRHPGAAARREFLIRSAALGAGLMLPAMALAGRLQQIRGNVTVNGVSATGATDVRALDIVSTAAGGSAILVMGKDAMLIRANSEVEILGKPKAAVLTGLRMLTGALLGVFGKGGGRQLLTSTATIGIRGTGIYMEASADQTYFCTCYGEVSIEDQHRGEKRLVLSGYHSPNIIHAEKKEGAMMQKAQFINHTDAELILLEKLVGRVPPFRRR
jgi:hypothetical protein